MEMKEGTIYPILFLEDGLLPGNLFGAYINPISHGVFDQRLVTGGGSLGPRCYFQLILTSFWTHGTINDQFIVFEGTLKIDRVIAIFVGEKNFSFFFLIQNSN